MFSMCGAKALKGIVALLLSVACWSGSVASNDGRQQKLDAVFNATSELAADSNSTPKPAKPDTSLAVVEQAKSQRNIELPEIYWSRYLSNIRQYHQEMDAAQTRALDEYKLLYISKLQNASDKELDAILSSRDQGIAARNIPAINKYIGKEARLVSQYLAYLEQFSTAALRLHGERMVRLDAEFKVCEKASTCWR